MRLVFDPRIGEHTQQALRAAVARGGGKGRRMPSLRLSPTSPRLLAALAGGAAAVVALAIAAPRLRASTPADREQRTIAPAAAGSGFADLERANAALAGNRPGEAVAAYEKAFASSSALKQRNAESYARALIEDGKKQLESDSDAAGERFRAALAVEPGLFDPHFYLAKIYTRKSDPQSAMREYEEAIRSNPKSADAQYNLGFVYFSQRRYEDALRQYEKALQLKPPYLADVFYNVSACYEQMKRKPDAIAALRRGLEAVPDSALLRARLKQLGG